MGDDFIKNKTKSYKRQNEKVHQQEYGQAGVSTLATDKSTLVFRFLVAGAEPKRGEAIILANVPGKNGVRVLQGTTPIGEVDAAGSTKLRSLFTAQPSLGGFLPGIVVSEKDVAGYAKAKVAL